MDLTYKFALISYLMAYQSGVRPENRHLKFLNELIQKMQQEEAIETMLILQNQEDRTCELQDWKPNGIPTLRLNQLSTIEVRNHFNSMAVGMVCICNESDTNLLENLAKDFNRMRQGRILLWLQIKPTVKMLKVIISQVEKHQFLQMLLLELKDKDKVSIRRLNLFPITKFDRIDDIFKINGLIFQSTEINFKGKTINLLPNWGATFKINFTVSHNVVIPIIRIQDYGVMDFAFKYNLNLSILEPSYNRTSLVPDIQLNTRIPTNMTDLKHWNPYDISSVLIIVPCGKKWRIHDMFKQLNCQSWLLHILLVYGIFVLAETFILMVTHRISGRAYRLTSLNPLLNLRAFRALLGMSFPISRRSSLSLRQLFLAISIFGFVFSNFINCKLSALLMKRFDRPHVRNFQDLRASGLPVIVGPTFIPFLKSEAGSDFMKHNLTRVKYISQYERVEYLLSFNQSNAYFMYSENWVVLDKYQKFFGRNYFCNCEYLTIIHGLPITYIFRDNSILEKDLSNFLMRLHENGIIGHWINRTPYLFRKTHVHLPRPAQKRNETPIGLVHLKWLWCVLGFGYGLSIMVFLFEIFIVGRKKKQTGGQLPMV